MAGLRADDLVPVRRGGGRRGSIGLDDGALRRDGRLPDPPNWEKTGDPLSRAMPRGPRAPLSRRHETPLRPQTGRAQDPPEGRRHHGDATISTYEHFRGPRLPGLL